MELIGYIKGITVDFLTGETVLTVSTGKKPAEIQPEFDKLKDKVCDLIFKVHREKRSLDANAYFHVLVGKIADEIGESKPAVKNMMICRYGQPLYIDEQQAVIKTQIPPEWMQEQEQLHCIACGNKVENGISLTFYRIYRGSHTYDTKEMALLIDGVVSEAKDLGIETMSPKEIERLMCNWNEKRITEE